MARLRVLVLVCALSPAARAAPRVAAPALQRRVQVALAVTEPTRALDAIKNAADDLGGHLVRGESTMVTVAVPDDGYRELLRRVRSLGDETDVRVTTTDFTDRIAAAQARLRAARESEARLSGVGGVAHGVHDRLQLEHALEDAKSAEDDARRELDDLERSVRQTEVVIRLSAPAVERVPRPRLPFAWLGKLGLSRLLDTSGKKPPSYRLSEVDDGNFYLQGGYQPDAAKLGGVQALGALGLTVRMTGDPDPVALFGGFDASLGASRGFVYGLQSIFGVAMPFGRRVALGVGSGPGIDGITSTIPFGVSFPVEAFFSLDLFKGLGTTLRVRDGWVLAAKARKHGAPAAPFGDEASATVTFAVGSRHGGHYSQSRNVPSLGLSVRQTMGATLYLVNLGFSFHESKFTRSD